MKRPKISIFSSTLNRWKIDPLTRPLHIYKNPKLQNFVMELPLEPTIPIKSICYIQIHNSIIYYFYSQSNLSIFLFERKYPKINHDNPVPQENLLWISHYLEQLPRHQFKSSASHRDRDLIIMQVPLTDISKTSVQIFACLVRDALRTLSIYPTLTLSVSMTIKQSVGTSQGRLSPRKSSFSSIFFLAMGMRSPFGDRCSATSVNACRRKLRHGLALRRTNRNGPGGRWFLDRMRKRDNDEREFVVRPRTTVPSLVVSALDHRRISPTLTVGSFRDSVHAFHRRFVYARPLFAGN